MKYVMCSGGAEMGTFPIIFPEHIGHDTIANAIKSTYPGITIDSAGFCTPAGNVYGESVTLALKSLSEDAFWIRKTLDIQKGD